MRNALEKSGRRDPRFALEYWRSCNSTVSPISPVPCNKVARTSLLSQASSDSAERLFSDLGRLEGRQRQSILSSTLEMTETIRVYSRLSVQGNVLPQTGVLHPKAAAFKQLIEKIAQEVVLDQK